MEFTLRAFETTDQHQLALHANNINLAKNMTNKFPHPYSLQDAKNFIEMVAKSDPLHVQAIAINEGIIGAIGVFPQDDIFCKNAEMGYWLAEAHWGKGIMTEAVKQGVEYGFSQFNVNRIFARPFDSNPASIRVLEKAGFHFEAKFEKTIFKFGAYHDELVYAIRK